MLQMKEQGEKLKDQINEEEIGNLSKQGLRAIIVMEFQNIENRMVKIQEIFHTFSKHLEEIKNKQTGTEIKNNLRGTNSRITEAEEWKVGRWN